MTDLVDNMSFDLQDVNEEHPDISQITRRSEGNLSSHIESLTENRNGSVGSSGVQVSGFKNFASWLETQ